LRHHDHDDQHGGESDLGLHIGIDENEHAGRAKSGGFARGNSAFERMANEERDRDRKHDRVVHIEMYI